MKRSHPIGMKNILRIMLPKSCMQIYLSIRTFKNVQNLEQNCLDVARPNCPLWPLYSTGLRSWKQKFFGRLQSLHSSPLWPHASTPGDQRKRRRKKRKGSRWSRRWQKRKKVMRNDCMPGVRMPEEGRGKKCRPMNYFTFGFKMENNHDCSEEIRN